MREAEGRSDMLLEKTQARLEDIQRGIDGLRLKRKDVETTIEATIQSLRNTLDFMQAMDVTSGLVKAAVFGFLIALMGCYQGYNSRGGAEGVGAAATAAVVSASILILAFDYVLTEMFFAR